MVQCRILFINVVDWRCWTLHAANLLNLLQWFEQQDSDVKAWLIHMDLFVPSRVWGVWSKILSTHHAWSQPFTNRLQTGCRFQSPCVVYQEPPHATNTRTHRHMQVHINFTSISSVFFFWKAYIIAWKTEIVRWNTDSNPRQRHGSQAEESEDLSGHADLDCLTTTFDYYLPYGFQYYNRG